MTDPEELNGCFNSILRDFPSVPVLCIPWLHLKHPSHPVQDMLMHGADRPAVPESFGAISRGAQFAVQISRSSSQSARALFCLANAVRMTFKIARMQWSLRKQIRTIRKNNFAVIAKSWCFGPQRNSIERDFYYGDLQARLGARGAGMLLLSGDANNSDWQAFARNNISESPGTRLPELCLSPLSAPIQYAFEQLAASAALMQRSSIEDSALMRAAMKQASLDVLDPAVTQDSLMFPIASAATNHWRPQVFMTLYEGHGWEKAAWQGAKQGHPGCRTVGYQHTVVFPEAASLLKPSQVPDVVLALGEQTANLLSKGHRGIPMVRFGSFRHSGAAASTSSDPAIRTVLVLPEGIEREATALFRFAYYCAQGAPSLRFILRAHPQWPAAKALERIEEPVLTLPNIELSDRAHIDDDFKRASVVLYRGSSAVLYGILNGLLAVNLRLPDMINSDPLDQITAWHETCGTTETFRELLARHERGTSAAREADWQKAVEYVKSYIVPVDDRSIDAFLDAVEIKRMDLCTA